VLLSLPHPAGRRPVLLDAFANVAPLAPQPRIWVQTQLKLAEVFKRKGDWDRVHEACEAIHRRTVKTAVSAEDLKKDLPSEGGWAELVKKSSDGEDAKCRRVKIGHC
jgi:hypothetical protein